MSFWQKDKDNTSIRTYRTTEDEYRGVSLPSGSPYPQYLGISGSHDPLPMRDSYPYRYKDNRYNEDIMDEDFINLVWEKMYKKKVVEFCKWCGAANAFDNPTCVQCGGPPG